MGSEEQLSFNDIMLKSRTCPKCGFIHDCDAWKELNHDIHAHIPDLEDK